MSDRVVPLASQVKRARLQALEYKRQYGTAMPSRLLTLAMADAAQVNKKKFPTARLFHVHAGCSGWVLQHGPVVVPYVVSVGVCI